MWTDFSNNNHLIFNFYILVSQFGKSFKGTAEWVYSCSCDKLRADFVCSLSTHIMTSVENFRICDVVGYKDLQRGHLEST